VLGNFLLKLTVQGTDPEAMVDSIQAAAAGISTAIASLDDAASRQNTPTMLEQHHERFNVPADQNNGVGIGPDGTEVRAGPTTDLNGTPTGEWPPGSVFAPGFLHADRRGLVAWPGLDGQLTRFLARRSVQANAEVIRQARESYDAINSLVGRN
jgi:hypothetical protein